MGSGGASGWGAALGPALLIGVLVTGCGASEANNGPAAGGSASPSAAATPPERLCARIVSHWSREALDGEGYGDYQSMGMSNGQYDILREVVDAARAEQERAGRKAAERLVDEEARTRCAKLYRDGNPTGGPWS
ncbi:hypothetical protein [Streptomyces neyagawaensis]|uniref:hypothetical protein n=1 Tax=Streptomyces neyagawaensis TaxID=42238 RepID=UPI0006E2BCB6|nr:hypothetical protein [Streptomyces neyagawaensis]MCL6733766.1 hypothetical protein [Streptomyces neyagawaensis]MDE1683995.1 hypothetical protein [Streptomyces neyagawaensis]